MSNIIRVTAAALALSLTAVPALADSQADTAGTQVKALLDRQAALHADLLQVRVEGQTVYVRGAVDSRLESTEVDQVIASVSGARVVNATVVLEAP